MSDTWPRHRVHPATVVIKTVRALPIVALAWLLFLDDVVPASARWLLAALLGLIVLTLGLSYLAWTRYVYGFDADGDFRLNSGVVVQRQRRLALSRLQSVDIVRPLVARVVGMASVRIEVAGDAAAVVEYLPEAQAQALRQEVLDRAGGKSGPDALPAPEEHLLQVSASDLLLSLLLHQRTVLALLSVVVGATAIVALFGPAGLIAYGLAVLVPLATVLGEFLSWYGFTVARSTDGARIRSGLLSTRAQTVPPGRVHAIEVSQPLLWRSRDWVRVSMNIAGTGSDDQRNGVAEVLLPVAPRAQAMRVIGDLLPNWPVADVRFEPAPPAAARRAWIQHRELGVAVTPDMLVTRRGRLLRRTAFVPHSRVQSVRLVRGPWQRALRLASVRADTVPGAVKVYALHRDEHQARELLDGESARMRQARAASGPQRWLAPQEAEGPQ